MDLSGVDECRDWVHSSKIPNSSRINEFYGGNLRDKAESGVKDDGLQKTETNIPHGTSDFSFAGGTLNSQLNGSGSKTAMDLSFRRTIFEEADYFARNHLYKLMPITFEMVNETIIHMEHNYCNSGSSESLSKMIHGETEERNYKKRKSKSGGFHGLDYEKDEGTDASTFLPNPKSDEDRSAPVQPLDLSLPVYHEQKTDKMLREKQSNVPRAKLEPRNAADLIQFNLSESNKENVTSSARKIEVTISRPGQREHYQPCEVFLNDVARISPDLIKNDCYEIDIIDRTGQDLEREKCRTYFIVSESTWHTFENSRERMILTNDLEIGEPVRSDGNGDRPKYLIFDRSSLTESLARMCEKRGGSFEYTCLEESSTRVSETGREVQDCGNELGGVASGDGEKEDNRKRHEEAVSRRLMTETNILKRLLMSEDRYVARPADKPVKTKPETVCDNSDEPIPTQTEPQVPTELNRDQEMREEKDEAATGDCRKNGIVPWTVTVGNTRRTRKAEDVAKKKRKRKLNEDIKLSNCGVSEIPSPKRVTRSSMSLTKEDPQAKKAKKKVSPGDGEETKQTKKKAQASENGNWKGSSAIDAGEKSRRRKLEVEGDLKRETRSTARMKAVENLRTTRTRTRKTEKSSCARNTRRR